MRTEFLCVSVLRVASDPEIAHLSAFRTFVRFVHV